MAENELVPGSSGALLAEADALVDEWLAYCRDADGATPATVDAYRRGLRMFARWLQGSGNAGAVGAPTVIRYKGWLQERYSVQTVNLRLTAVRSFYRWCVLTERLVVSPAASVKGVKRPRSRQHKRDKLANGEVVAVLATCGSDLAGVRDRAILTLMAYCALRAIEVHRANIGNLRTDGDRLVLDVHGKGRLEADDMVVIPVSQEGVIRGWLAHRVTFRDPGDGDPLFISLSNQNRGQRLSTQAIRQLVKARYRQAGVVGNRKTTHSLRHSALSKVAETGGMLQVKALGRHASFDSSIPYIHEVARVSNPPEDLIEYGATNGDVEGA